MSMKLIDDLTSGDKDESGWTLAVILIAVFAIWAASGWLLASEENRGTFGDMFGAVNALFSGCAFATLIYTVFLQRKELSLQRKELEYTRIELKRSATAQEASEVALRAQAEAAAQSASLAAITALLNYYREEIAKISEGSFILPTDRPLFALLQQRETALEDILDDTYQKITSEHTGKQKAQA